MGYLYQQLQTQKVPSVIISRKYWSVAFHRWGWGLDALFAFLLLHVFDSGIQLAQYCLKVCRHTRVWVGVHKCMCARTYTYTQELISLTHNLLSILVHSSYSILQYHGTWIIKYCLVLFLFLGASVHKIRENYSGPKWWQSLWRLAHNLL